MRLIDADELKKNLKSVTLSNGTLLNTNTVLLLLDKYPTAYDVDKVVEQLKTDSLVKLYGSGNSDNYLIPVKRAIEIVKAGGIDER
jgi:hypothetical protein